MLRKLISVSAEIGWFNTVLHGLNRLFATLGMPLRIIRYRFTAQPIAATSLLPPRRGTAIDVRMLAEGDPALSKLPLTPEVLRYRFGQGAVCFGAFLEGEVAGCLWFCFGRYDEDEVRCLYLTYPPEKTVWDFDVYVAPAARGGFTFVRMWDVANAYLRQRGVRWSLSRISAFNPGSLRAHARLGARPTSSVSFLKAGRWQLMLAGQAPFIHLSTGIGSTPALTIRAPCKPPMKPFCNS